MIWLWTCLAGFILGADGAVRLRPATAGRPAWQAQRESDGARRIDLKHPTPARERAAGSRPSGRGGIRPALSSANACQSLLGGGDRPMPGRPLPRRPRRSPVRSSQRNHRSSTARRQSDGRIIAALPADPTTKPGSACAAVHRHPQGITDHNVNRGQVQPDRRGRTAQPGVHPGRPRLPRRGRLSGVSPVQTGSWSPTRTPAADREHRATSSGSARTGTSLVTGSTCASQGRSSTMASSPSITSPVMVRTPDGRSRSSTSLSAVTTAGGELGRPVRAAVVAGGSANRSSRLSGRLPAPRPVRPVRRSSGQNAGQGPTGSGRRGRPDRWQQATASPPVGGRRSGRSAISTIRNRTGRSTAGPAPTRHALADAVGGDQLESLRPLVVVDEIKIQQSGEREADIVAELIPPVVDIPAGWAADRRP